jgi:hypothetical protein
MAQRRSYAEIAAVLNRAGLRSAFGRPFTSQHVGYVCRRDGLAKGKPRAGSTTQDSSDASASSRSWTRGVLCIRSIQAKQQPVVELPWIIDAVTVDQEWPRRGPIMRLQITHQRYLLF